MTGVIVGHQWMGLGDMERYRCDQLAAAGYFAFALDVYGKGVRPTTVAEAQGNVSAVEKNLTDFHAKLRHAVEMVKGFGLINQTHMFANGYCFGGEMVLELARLGVPEVKGVASFHGELGNLTAQSSDKITAVVQVHHADLDFQHAQGLLDFEDEMCVCHARRRRPLALLGADPRRRAGQGAAPSTSRSRSSAQGSGSVCVGGIHVCVCVCTFARACALAELSLCGVRCRLCRCSRAREGAGGRAKDEPPLPQHTHTHTHTTTTFTHTRLHLPAPPAYRRNRSVAYWTTSKYGNCEHGWTDPTSQNYRPFEAKEAHDAMFSLYARLL